MILARTAFIRTLQAAVIGFLILGCVACFLFSYSFVTGDSADRDDMTATIARLAPTIIPAAQAETPDTRASLF